jgi:hypothetical protein
MPSDRTAADSGKVVRLGRRCGLPGMAGMTGVGWPRGFRRRFWLPRWSHLLAPRPSPCCSRGRAAERG